MFCRINSSMRAAPSCSVATMYVPTGMLAIPADAKHPKNAHAFINYLMEPQVAANDSNFVNYANGNAASFAMVSDEVKNDPGIYPTPEVKAKLFPSLAYGEDFQRLMNRMWTKFQTGQ